MTLTDSLKHKITTLSTFLKKKEATPNCEVVDILQFIGLTCL